MEGIKVFGSRVKYTFFGVFIFLSLLSGCNSAIPTGAAISDFGEHHYDDGVVVSVSNNAGVVCYELRKPNGEVAIVSQDRASIYQRWMLLWDGNYLWFASSDIGGKVWVKEGSAKYLPKYFRRKPDVIRDMPKEVSDFIN